MERIKEWGRGGDGKEGRKLLQRNPWVLKTAQCDPMLSLAVINQ